MPPYSDHTWVGPPLPEKVMASIRPLSMAPAPHKGKAQSKDSVPHPRTCRDGELLKIKKYFDNERMLKARLRSAAMLMRLTNRSLRVHAHPPLVTMVSMQPHPR